MIFTATIFALGTLLGALGTTTGRHHMTSRTQRIRRALFGTRRRKIASTVAVLALMTASVALAAWIVSGNGEAGGRIGQLQALTVTARPSSDTCLPGGSCDGSVHVVNPNSGPLVLTNVSSSNAHAPVGFTASCPEENVTVPNQTINVSVPGGADADYVIPDAFALSASAPNACADVAFERSLLVQAATP